MRMIGRSQLAAIAAALCLAAAATWLVCVSTASRTNESAASRSVPDTNDPPPLAANAAIATSVPIGSEAGDEPLLPPRPRPATIEVLVVREDTDAPVGDVMIGLALPERHPKRPPPHLLLKARKEKRPERPDLHLLWAARTDPDGVCRLRSDFPGALRVLALDPDLGAEPVQVLAALGATTPARLTIRAVTEVAGRVLDLAGNPVPSASVVVRWAGGEKRTSVKADGAFTLRGLYAPDAAFEVTVTASDTQFVDRPSTVVLAERGRRVDTPTLFLGDRGATARGMLATNAGPPLSGVSLRATGDNGSVHFAMSDAAGEFRFVGLDDQRYVVEALDAQVQIRTFEIHGRQDADLGLMTSAAPSITVTGTVVLPQDLRAKRVEVVAEGVTAQPTLDGRFRVELTAQHPVPVHVRIEEAPWLVHHWPLGIFDRSANVGTVQVARRGFALHLKTHVNVDYVGPVMIRYRIRSAERVLRYANAGPLVSIDVPAGSTGRLQGTVQVPGHTRETFNVEITAAATWSVQTIHLTRQAEADASAPAESGAG